MHVLIADSLPSTALDRLNGAGFDVTFEPNLAGDALRDAIRRLEPEVIVVRSTRLSEEMFRESRNLGLVVRAGAGTNTIDVAAASALGVYVANCPGRNAAAVAELAFGLLIAADRQIPNATRDLRNGVWAKKKYAKAAGLHGRTIGLLGLGSIGREVAIRAHAFGMNVVAWSRSLTDEAALELGVARASTPLEVARQSDAVSVHVALTDDTRELIDREFVAAMKPGGIFVNTSRGGVVNEEALAWGVRERGLRCGLDVFADEPSGSEPFESPLVDEELVFGTHHIGASTEQAQEAVALEAVRVVEAYRDTGDVPNCVNLCEQSPATHMLVVRHKDEVGALAGIFDLLRAAEINVQETQNIIFDGARAAVARIRTDRAPNDDLLAGLRSSESVLAVGVIDLGR